MSKRGLALSLPVQIHACGLPAPVLEARFHPTRRWRFDLSWPDKMLACEIEGGVYQPGGSRHSRGPGFEKDCIKYAEALCLGWRVLRVTTGQVKSGQALAWVETLLRMEP